MRNHHQLRTSWWPGGWSPFPSHIVTITNVNQIFDATSVPIFTSFLEKCSLHCSAAFWNVTLVCNHVDISSGSDEDRRGRTLLGARNSAWEKLQLLLKQQNLLCAPSHWLNGFKSELDLIFTRISLWAQQGPPAPGVVPTEPPTPRAPPAWSLPSKPGQGWTHPEHSNNPNTPNHPWNLTKCSAGSCSPKSSTTRTSSL